MVSMVTGSMIQGITKIYARKSDVVVKLRDNPVVRASKRGESQLVFRIQTPETRIIFTC